MAGLELAQDYWIDIDEDGKGGEEEDKDEDEVSGADEKKDLVFFAIPAVKRIMVLDITRVTDITPYGVITVRNRDGDYAVNIRDLELSEKDRLLYATDMQMGLVILDMNLWGKTMEPANQGERYLGNISTTGHSQLGLVIDEELKTAYVGQAEKGIEVIKLGNPELKFVYKTLQGTYREVTKICPAGIKPGDNPGQYPEEIYVMGIFPGGIAKRDETGVDDKTVYCEVWSLNPDHAPSIPWDNSKIKTRIKKLNLIRQSDNPVDDLYRVFLSKPLRVTAAPDEKMMKPGKIQLSPPAG